MCRSIVTLRRRDEMASEKEVRAAALQFVRKISGYRVPSRANDDAFNTAVDEIAAASRHLLTALFTASRQGQRVITSPEAAEPGRQPSSVQ